MRIAIDASTISTQGGPRSYLLGLIAALLRIDRENEYIVFYNDEAHVGLFPEAKEIVLLGSHPLARLWREHRLLPQACREERVDILHCPKSAVPFWSPCPVVVTLHDLIPVKHPETEKFAARVYWRLQIPIAAKRSDFIITISEHARREIMAEYGIPDERIAVIMQSFDPAMLQPRDAGLGRVIRERYGLPAEYILYVGTIQPRKNLITLIEAYAALVREGRITASLVIVGRKGWLYEGLFARLRELDLAEKVIFTGFVPDEALPFIYDNARLFVYLSLFEGFGRPPLEAMACGVPVIASDTTAIPEVVGDAGITLPPTDREQVAAAIERVLTDPVLAASMREKGLARARTFSWEKAAQETLDVYRRVAGECGKSK